MSLRVSNEEYRALEIKTGKVSSDTTQSVSKRPSKYHNRKTAIDGLVFDSSAEARRYNQLLYLLRAGVISDLRRQVKFPLAVAGVTICNYIADFAYMDGGKQVVEDVKGVTTPVYRLKKKLMWAILGIAIREVRMD